MGPFLAVVSSSFPFHLSANIDGVLGLLIDVLLKIQQLEPGFVGNLIAKNIGRNLRLKVLMLVYRQASLYTLAGLDYVQACGRSSVILF